MSKLFYRIMIILIVFLLNICTICYAYVPVTEENLKEAIEKLLNSEETDIDASVTLSNNVITIKSSNVTYCLDYDLTSAPTFSIEVPIKQGMTYEEFSEQVSNTNLVIIGYEAVANIQKMEQEDAIANIMKYLLESTFKDMLLTNDRYDIIDDTANNIEEKSNDSKIIYVSEFGDRVMEYVNYTYGNAKHVTDSETFNWTIERKNVTETSCNLVSTLTVNIDGNFEQIKGMADEVDSELKTEEENQIISDDNKKSKEDVSTSENTVLSDEQIRQNEKANLRELEKEYRAEKNKVPNAGDPIILILKVITCVSIIALVVVIVCSKIAKK